MMFTCLVIIIAYTVAMEILTLFLERNVHKDYQLLIQTMYKEIMNLGLVSLVLVAVEVILRAHYNNFHRNNLK